MESYTFLPGPETGVATIEIFAGPLAKKGATEDFVGPQLFSERRE